MALDCSKALLTMKLQELKYFLAAGVCSGTSLIPQPSNAKQKSQQHITGEVCEHLYLACQTVEGQLFLYLNQMQEKDPEQSWLWKKKKIK